MRSSLWAAWSACCATTWRARRRACGCSRSAACSARPPAADGERGGRRAPADARGRRWPTARPTAQWGERERAVDFFDVKGDVEALLRRCGRFRGRHRTRRCTRGAARASRSTAAIGHVGELHPRGARPTTCRRRRCCSNSTSTRCSTRPCRRLPARVAPAGRVRDLALVVADGVAHDALMASLAPTPGPGACRPRCSTSTSPTSRRPASAAHERSLAVRLELLDFDNTLTDERIDNAVAAAVARVQPAFGARLRA
jgi:phenylalanyl-tRNA synthetase beta chain